MFDLLALVVGNIAVAARGPVLVVELLEPLPWGARLVVDAAGTPVPGAFASDGFLGWGEQVGLDAHQFPQLVRQVELVGRVPVVDPVV